MSASQETPYTRTWLEQRLGSTPAPTAAPDPLVVGSATPAMGLGLRDDEVRECVNELRRLALTYGGSQQLRDRLASYIGPILRGERRP